MEQNYRQEDPNVSDLRRAMIIRGALLDGFHMETRPNGTLAFVKHDANKKMVYIDVPTSNMPVSIYAANMQKIGEVYNARAENFEKMHPDVKLPRMQTDFEIIQGNPAVKGKAFKTIQSDMGDEIEFYSQMKDAYRSHNAYLAPGIQGEIFATMVQIKRCKGYSEELYQELYSYFTSPEISEILHFPKDYYDEKFAETFEETHPELKEPQRG